VDTAVLAGPKVGNVGIALAFGLALHRKIGPTDAVAYIVAQIVGTIIAAGLLLAIARGGREATTLPWPGWGPTAMASTHLVIMPWARPSSLRPS